LALSYTLVTNGAVVLAKVISYLHMIESDHFEKMHTTPRGKDFTTLGSLSL
jgi:hypothetical protein